MSRLHQLKKKLAARENALGTTIANVSWSGLIQKIALYPFDFVLFDVEHGTLSLESIEESLRICRWWICPRWCACRIAFPISSPKRSIWAPTAYCCRAWNRLHRWKRLFLPPLLSARAQRMRRFFQSARGRSRICGRIQRQSPVVYPDGIPGGFALSAADIGVI